MNSGRPCPSNCSGCHPRTRVTDGLTQENYLRGVQVADADGKVTFTSTPSGAAVTLGGKKRGTTPVTLDVACSRDTASFARSRYVTESKAFTPSAKKTVKVAVRLDRPTFTLRISSSPSGATAIVGGKTVGRTPVTTKVRGFEAVTVKVSRSGYATKTSRVTAKKNGTTLKVTLKKGR